LGILTLVEETEEHEYSLNVAEEKIRVVSWLSGKNNMSNFLVGFLKMTADKVINMKV
jgi:hypothetical protein